VVIEVGKVLLRRMSPSLARPGKISAPHQTRRLSRVQETRYLWAGPIGSMPVLDPNVWTGGALQEKSVAAEIVWSCTNVSGLNLEPLFLAIMDMSAQSICLISG
jgi:hypothetical protein